mmetsp:Transcript_166768/g.320233  ORF Transcript_166768/g.320233 Transcript_166768/m.320233 type:complete len:187 (-) Transcript_166768:57-617(-)
MPQKLGSGPARFAKRIREQKTEAARLNALFQKYDIDNSSSLDREQLGNLLRALGAPDRIEPTKDDIDYVLKTCDKRGSGKIEKDELEDAVNSWDLYVHHKADIDTVFKKYDTNGSGSLERDQLSAYLGDMMQDAISDADIQYVLENADATGTGAINKMELERATSALALRKAKESGQEEKGGCCLQ